MSVAVCKESHIPAWVIRHAGAEAAEVFRAIDVEIHWTSCGAELRAPDARMRPDLVVRVLTRKHINMAGPASNS